MYMYLCFNAKKNMEKWSNFKLCIVVACCSPSILAQKSVQIWHLNCFLKEFLEDISPFCRDTDTPVLNFWRGLLWVSKPEWISLLACFVTCMQWIPQIHLWRHTCWRLGSHGDRTVLILLNFNISVCRPYKIQQCSIEHLQRHLKSLFQVKIMCN